MEQYGGTIRWVFEADDTQFNQAVDNIQNKSVELKEAINATDKSFDSLGKKGQELNQSFRIIGNAAKSIGFSLLTAGATAATSALTSMAQKGIEGADALAKYNSQIIGLAKSTTDANSAMSTAVDFFKNNPFQRFETIEAVKNLMQFDKSIANADTGSRKLRETLDMLGVASLSTGTGISELASQWGEISNTSRVSIGQLDEFAMRVPALWDAIGKRVGKSASEVREAYLGVGVAGDVVRGAMQDLYGLDTEKLNGTKEEIDEYLSTLTGSARQSAEAYLAFGNTMARQTDRVKGRLADMQAAIAGYKITVEGGFEPTQNGIYQSLINLKKAFADTLASSKPVGKLMAQAFGKIGEAIAPFINKIAEKLPSILENLFTVLDKFATVIKENKAVLIPIFGLIATFFGKLASKVPIVNNILSSFTGKIGALKAGIVGLAKANPVLAAFIGLFAGGLVSAMKNSEKFRESIGKIFSSISTIMTKLMPVITQMVELFAQILSSPAMVSILETIADAIAGIAEAIASLPTEVLTFFVTALMTIVALNRLSPWTVFAVGMATAIGALSEWVNAIGGIKNIPAELGKFFASLPGEMVKIGQNIIGGLVKGVTEAAGWLWNAIGNIANGIITTFRGLLGIHSPSTVMEQQGEYVGLGLAEGITNSKSTVQKAMSELAKAVYQTSQKVIGNKKDFGVLDVTGTYKAWKQVSKLFVQGSEEYQEAMEQMEEARKEANLQILKLQENYNDTLDETIGKVKNFYGLFSTVNQKGGMGSGQILGNLDKQLAQLQGFSEAQNIISNLDLDETLIEELQGMGIDSVNELQAIANMTGSELESLNSLWKQKQELANKTATHLMENLKDSTLEQIGEIKNGIDDETIDVRDVGGRLVSEIGEGITGALPTLKSAYSELNDYIKKAQKELAKSAGGASTAGTASPNIPDTSAGAGVGDIKKSIEESMGKLGSQLGFAAGGILGGALLVKLIPKLGQVLKKGGAAKKIGKTISNAVSQSDTISKSTSSITKNLGSTGQSFQKVNGILNVIIKGAAAVAAVAGAIAAMALALRVTYEALKGVDWGELAGDLAGMAIVMGVMSTICGIVGKFAKYVALGAVVEVVISGVIALSAILLAKASEYAKIIDHGALYAMEGVLTVASVILGIIGAFAKFVALGSIVEVVISGALLACAFLLKQAGDIASEINSGAIFAMEGTLAGVNAILIALGALAIPATLGVIIEDVFSGGLLVLAALLKNASDLATGIDENNLKNLTKCLDTAIAGINKVGLLSSIVGTVKTIIDDLFSGAFMLLANNLREASDKGSGITEEGIDNVVKAIGTIADLGAGDILKNLANIVNSGTLIPVSSSVRDIANNLADIKSDNLDEEAIKKIKRIVEDFSTINISGSGLFESKGDKAREVASIAESAKNIARNFADFPDENYEGKVQNFVRALGAFQDITPKVRKGITDFRSLGDSLGNIDWIKKIFGDVPEDIHSRAERLVDSIKLFDRIDENARIGARHINAMGDSLSNIDWIKRIFGDVPEDIWSKAEKLVNSIKLFDRIDENARNGALRLKDMGDSIGNIDWVKKIFSDIPTDIETKAEGLVNGVKKIASLQLEKEDLGDLSTIALFVQAVVNKINSSADQLRNGGASVIDYIKQGMTNANDKAQSAGANLVLQVALGIGKNLDKLKTAGSETQGAFWNGIQAKMQDEYHQGAALTGEVAKGIGSKYQDMYNSGGYAVEGFKKGIESKNWMLSSTGIKLAETFLEAFKKRAGEGSPWKTTFQSGQFAAEGLINGLTSMEGEIVSEADLIADSIVEALDLSDTTLTPSVAFGGTMAPAMEVGESGYGGGRDRIVINQENTFHTDYSVEQMNRDLSWELSKV